MLFRSPNEYQTNVREACRQAIAGGYLKAYDEKEKLRVYVKSLGEQVVATEAALVKAKKELENAKAKAAQVDFDLGLAAKRDEAATAVQNLELQSQNYQALKKQAAQDFDKAKAGEQDLKKLVDRVFVFDRQGDHPDGGYPIHINYKSACPKFRHL